jgi:hypothetical protein
MWQQEAGGETRDEDILWCEADYTNEGLKERKKERGHWQGGHSWRARRWKGVDTKSHDCCLGINWELREVVDMMDTVADRIESRLIMMEKRVKELGGRRRHMMMKEERQLATEWEEQGATDENRQPWKWVKRKREFGYSSTDLRLDTSTEITQLN